MAVLLLVARVSSLPCPGALHHGLCYWQLGPPCWSQARKRQLQVRGTNPTQGRANPPPWPRARALMARVPLGLAQLPGGQRARVSGGQPGGDPRSHQGGGSGDIHLDSSHHLGSIPGPPVAGAAGEVVAASVREMQEAELGMSFLPMAQHPHRPSRQRGAGPPVLAGSGVAAGPPVQ